MRSERSACGGRDYNPAKMAQWGGIQAALPDGVIPAAHWVPSLRRMRKPVLYGCIIGALY